MDEQPVTEFAETFDGVSVAYQVFGAAPLNVVLPTEFGVPIDLWWEEPAFVRFARRLGGFTRTVLCEVRGVGASGGNFLDAVSEETGNADLLAVLDASGCETAVLIGSTSGGPMVIRFAVGHPDRCRL